MRTSIKSIPARKMTLLVRTLFACLVVFALSFAAISTWAGPAQTKAEKAFAKWKAAQQAVAAAKEKLADAQKALQNAMTAVAKSGGKTTAAQEAALAQGRAEVARAEAALREAEKQELAARLELENEIAELPDGPLKDQLKRERNFPSVVVANGLRTVKFDTPSGQLTLNLPDDMTAGDTITGTVIPEPKGSTEEERNTHRGVLNGYVVQIAGQSFPVNKGSVGPFVIRRLETPKGPGRPPTDNSFFDVFVAIDPNDSAAARARIPLLPSGAVITPDPNVTPTFVIPPLGQTGRPIVISGPFDGNSSNTTLNGSALGTSVQDFEQNTRNVSGGFGLIAESTRKAVFKAPTDVTGPIELHLTEGKTQTTGNYRNVGVNLTAPKTSLLKGESTTLTVQVTGLQGIKEPVPLTLDSQGVITMEGGMYQPLIIQPSQIGADGRYTTMRGITGVETGNWTSTATVVTQPFNIVLRDPSPPQTILVNSFTGDYIFCGSGSKLSGTGQIKRQGCVITLTDNRPDRRVQGTLNSCMPVDNGRFSVFYSPGTTSDIVVTVFDTQPPKTRIYFNTPGRPRPPVQDVSAFATCP
ncbi:MAG TPA: hypothetical protein VGJ55_08320 [Pyrinomonadaceae bacterium]